MPSRCCIQYGNNSGRPSSGHRTRKGQSSSQFPRRVVLKNVLTIRQLHSSPILVRSWLKSCILGFSMLTKNFQKSNLGLETAEKLFATWFPDAGKEINQCNNHANIHWIIEKATEFHKNIHLCFIDYTKAFDCVDRDKSWKALIEMGTDLTCLLRNLYASQKATVRTLYGTTDWFRIEKEYTRLFMVTLFI